ncbi:MAG: serine/threonine-protein kinase, partial [Proteobacteria bacterium]|nr:serine/threonine-protein kinase [Pseudomonadota bacterium]
MPDDSGPDSEKATLLGHVSATTPPVSPVGSPTQDTLVPLEPIDPRGLTLPDAGYTIGDMIGRGGMGEIMSATDRRIGREVAIKRMRGASSEPHAIVRFLREARIQARLDHPSIVPVHELGTDDNGRPFFTMKRLVATTLLDKLAKPGPMQPLLRAFIDVCMAVELAHQRGVVHRDLKPANIMLGDFGEVYVIDWGVARVLSERPAAAQNDIDTLDEGSETAGMLGTPGYMAPEQIDGSDVSTATDVYALGAILFEILTAEPLHPRGRGAIATTLDTPQDAPAKRKPDREIPPELDTACFDALAREPKDRPTARQLGERVQAYLEGDRDTAQRRKLAAEQLAQAHAALASDDVDGRATAMRKAGRALALDPESIPAGELVTKLMLEPPTVLPPALRDRLDDDERVSAKARSRTAMIVYLSVFLFVLPVPWMTVASWPWFIALNLTVAGLAAT